MQIIFAILLLSLFVSGTVFSAGFSLIEPSARANGMGGATVAQGGDASVLFVNPAAMTGLPGVQVETGVIILRPSVDIVTYGDPYLFKDNLDKPSQTGAVGNTFYIPHLYVTSQLTENLWLGLGTFSRFGLGVEYPQSWPGRYNSYYAKVSSAEVNPNLAYKVSDRLSLSAGVSMMYFDVKLQQKLPAVVFIQSRSDDLDQTFSGDSIGYGFNLGLHYRATDWMTIGVSYRSRIKQKMAGQLIFDPEVAGLDEDIPSALPSTNADTTIELPDQYYFGIAFKPLDRLTWEIGGVLTGWRSYDHVKIELEKPILGDNTKKTDKQWKDSWRFQTGLEYKTTDWLNLRLGYVYDQSPVPYSTIEFAMPDSDRHILGIGVGFHKNNWSIDLSYNYLILKDRDIIGRNFSKVVHLKEDSDPNTDNFLPDAQTKNGKCHIIGASLGYKF